MALKRKQLGRTLDLRHSAKTAASSLGNSKAIMLAQKRAAERRGDTSHKNKYHAQIAGTNHLMNESITSFQRLDAQANKLASQRKNWFWGPVRKVSLFFGKAVPREVVRPGFSGVPGSFSNDVRRIRNAGKK